MERILKKQLPGGIFKEVSAKRSQNMAAIKGHNNKTTERRLRFALVQAGIKGWKLNAPELKGKPDFFFPAKRVVVFVDGCFWHGCPKCGHVPKTNSTFWRTKIRRNKERDSRTTTALQEQGFTVIRFWEHELTDSLSACVAKVLSALELSE